MSDLRDVSIKAPPKDHVPTLTAIPKAMQKDDQANSLGRSIREAGTLAHELHEPSPPESWKDFVDGRVVRQFQKFSGGRLHFYYVFPDGGWTDTKERALLYKEDIKDDPLPEVLGNPLAPPKKQKRKRRARKTKVSITFSPKDEDDDDEPAHNGKKHRKERRSSPKVTVAVECESDSGDSGDDE